MDGKNHSEGSQINNEQQTAAQGVERNPELIDSLTSEVEHGNSCVLKGVLRAMPFEESLKTLKDIAEKNKTDRNDDPSIPEVFFLSGGAGTQSYGELFSPAGPRWWNGYNTLIKDTLSLNDTSTTNVGDRSLLCMATTKSNRISDK